MSDYPSPPSPRSVQDDDHASASATWENPDCAPLAELLHALPCLVATVGPDEVTQFVNEAVRPWRGAAPEELTGKHVSHVVGGRNYARTRQFVSAALAGVQQRFEHTLTLATGAVLHAQVDLVPAQRDGRPHGFHLLATDISDRVLAEASMEEAIAQAALLHERSRIAADMHDRVIQHLYAAGLGAHRAKSGDADAADYIDAMTICINDAIHELRGAIRKLTVIPEPASLRDALAPIARQVSRWLGHDPTIHIRGRLEDLPPDIAHAVLIALSRMLASVTVRSHVSDVRIDIEHEGEVVRVRVTDDGLPPPDSSADTPQMDLVAQAAALQGGFAQQPNRPHGTVMQWWAPIHPPAL